MDNFFALIIPLEFIISRHQILYLSSIIYPSLEITVLVITKNESSNTKNL